MNNEQLSGEVHPLVSVVLPCLNEAGSVGAVVTAALACTAAAGLSAEVVVADNGSTDGSAAEAATAGARVVTEAARGYGNAYHAGMGAAQGRVLVMADADGTYPMEAIPELVGPVLAGTADLVIGNRLQGVARRAMPWTHRYIGNPLLTGLLNRFSGVAVSDAHSGMRAIDSDAYARLRLVTPGMEYASEMIVQAARTGLRVAERPIEYRRRVGDSKLDTWPDGWRHLKFLLLASPNWLFLVPGSIIFFLGFVLVVPLTFGSLSFGSIHLALHPMFFGSALVIVGFQIVQFGVLVRGCAPMPRRLEGRLDRWLQEWLTIERTLIGGVLVLLGGIGVEVAVFVEWATSGFANIYNVRQGVTALTLCVLGTQTIFGGFLYAFFLPSRFAWGPAPAARGERTGTNGKTDEGVPLR
ncbi:MAG: glycosyltransferase family 2 protein [Actinomycetota bacterium]|nr:glycosyltransferase family 2 protein [Actinomycetota bacterium]